MFKYLIATDGSENSLRAAEYVLSVAGKHKNVQVNILSVKDAAAWFTESVDEYVQKTAAVFDGTDLKVNTLIKEGRAAETIVETANELGVDQIIMGARGLGKIKGMVLGSVSQQVVKLSERPVTIIK
ncbi:MAG: universal stress protein [Bacillota bacterium]